MPQLRELCKANSLPAWSGNRADLIERCLKAGLSKTGLSEDQKLAALMLKRERLSPAQGSTGESSLKTPRRHDVPGLPSFNATVVESPLISSSVPVSTAGRRPCGNCEQPACPLCSCLLCEDGSCERCAQMAPLLRATRPAQAALLHAHQHERFNNLTGMLFESVLMSSGISSESPFRFFVPS